ncbi:MAG: hypothetical protein Q4C91_00040 [Eubacteriales bacterium]|nr:hypothetical protein [Eubacteriales bacterium]
MNKRKKKKQIQTMLVNLTDREFFLSRSYYEDISKTVRWLGQRQDICLVLDYNEKEEADIAYTNGKKLYLNTANQITRILPERTDKIKSHKGFAAHECGHLRFSDFNRRGRYLGGFLKWLVYPNPPEARLSYEKKAWEEMKGYLKSHNLVAAMVIKETAAHINNLLEDVYIESCMCREYQGSIQNNLQRNAEIMLSHIPTEAERRAQKSNGLTIMQDMLLRYARAGDTEAETAYSRQYRSRLNACKKIIDEAVVSDDPDIRYTATNRLMLKLWKYIKQTIKTVERKLKNEIAGLSEDELKKRVQDYLKRVLIWLALSEVPGYAEGHSGPELEIEGWNGDLDGSGGTQTQTAPNEELREELEQMRKEQRTERGETEDDSESMEELEDLFRQLAEELCGQDDERNLQRKLQQEADEMKLEGVHKESMIKVHRQEEIPVSMEKEYRQAAPEIMRVAKKLEDAVEEVLKRRDGGTMSGLYLGKRLCRGELYRQDDKVFEREIQPEEGFSIAFAVLLDISGSMYTNDRIKYAKKAGLVLYTFCKDLEIPIMLYGHTTHFLSNGQEVVDIHSYADFDSVDNQDHLRIMGIKTGGCNRDGVALRFVGKKLLERQEELKILLQISDGQPNAQDYEGEAAKKDLQEAKRDLEKRGIKLFTAAIGDDRKLIEEIYTNGYLNISDLKKMPTKLGGLITRFIR